MIKKLIAKKNKGGLVPANPKQLQVATPLATLEGEDGSWRIQQAPPPSNDSIPPFEELEPYMDEQIAQEYFAEVAPVNISFANSYLGIDLTSSEYCGSATNPNILIKGAMLHILARRPSKHGLKLVQALGLSPLWQLLSW